MSRKCILTRTFRKSSGFWHNTQSTSIWFKILWLEKHLFGGYIWSVFIVQLWHWWLKLSWGEAEKWDLPRRLHLNSAGIEFKDFSFNSNASNNADLITQGVTSFAWLKCVYIKFWIITHDYPAKKVVHVFSNSKSLHYTAKNLIH